MNNLIEIEVTANGELYDTLYVPEDGLNDFWGEAASNWPGETTVTGPDENRVYALRLDGDGDVEQWLDDMDDYREERLSEIYDDEIKADLKKLREWFGNFSDNSAVDIWTSFPFDSVKAISQWGAGVEEGALKDEISSIESTPQAVNNVLQTISAFEEIAGAADWILTEHFDEPEEE